MEVILLIRNKNYEIWIGRIKKYLLFADFAAHFLSIMKSGQSMSPGRIINMYIIRSEKSGRENGGITLDPNIFDLS